MNDQVKDYEAQLKQELSEIEFQLEGREDIRDFVFRRWLAHSLQYESPKSLGCDVEVFAELRNPTKPQFSLYEFAFAVNCIEGRTQLEMSTLDDGYDYIYRMRMIGILGKDWNAVVHPIRTKIQRKLQTLNRIAFKGAAKN